MQQRTGISNNGAKPTGVPRPPATSSASSPSQNWTVEDLADILTGTTPHPRLREADSRGLTAPSYGAIEAAKTASALLPLLGLLEAPDGAGKLDLIIELLMKIAASQERAEKLVADIAKKVGITNDSSQQQSTAA